MIGIRQKCLLRCCYLKGSISTREVGIYYNIGNGRKRLGILEKLQLLGFLKSENKNRFVLSGKGRTLVEELIKNV